MKTFSRPRLVVPVFALLALPALTCGVAPALRDLMLRMQRVESYLANVQLPPLLVDSAGNVVGPVLEYNRMFLFASVDSYQTWISDPELYVASSPFPGGNELATVLYTPSGGTPLHLDASPNELLALEHGWPQYFYFESSDCTGSAWVRKEPQHPVFAGSVHPRVRIAAPGRTLYAEDLSSPGESRPLRSSYYAVGHNSHLGGGIGTESACNPLPAFYPGPGDDFRPLRAVADLDALFTPPFRLIAQGPMATAP